MMPLLPFAQRLRQVLNVLVKHGFGYLIESLNLQHYLSLGRRIITFDKKRTPSPNRAKIYSKEAQDLLVTVNFCPKKGQVLDNS